MKNLFPHGTCLADGILQIQRGQAPGLRHAVSLDETDTLFLVFLDDGDGNGGAAGDEKMDVGEIRLVPFV